MIVIVARKRSRYWLCIRFTLSLSFSLIVCGLSMLVAPTVVFLFLLSLCKNQPPFHLMLFMWIIPYVFVVSAAAAASCLLLLLRTLLHDHTLHYPFVSVAPFSFQQPVYEDLYNQLLPLKIILNSSLFIKF